MAQLPVEVRDTETVVRVIKSPYHFRNHKTKTRLSKAAFQPRKGKREISVIRQILGDDFCKDKSVAIASKDPNSEYEGLAPALVRAIRAANGDVIDAREDYCGHAHLISPEERPRDDGDPPDPQVMEKLDEFYNAMIELFAWYADPSPESPGWTGPPLRIHGSAGSTPHLN